MIKTKRCVLKRLTEDDRGNIKRLYQNIRVRKYLGGIVNDAEFFKRFQTMYGSEADYFVVKLQNTEQFVGLISLCKYYDGVNIEVSYQILPEFWGRGLASEALQAVLEFAFTDLGLKKIYAETQTANHYSCLLLEKVGFSLSANIRRFNEDQSVFVIEPTGLR